MDYPINFAEQLAQHLKAFRKSRSMTQTELAEHLGVRQSRIAEVEANPGTVSFENLLKILTALDVRVVLKDSTVEVASSKAENKIQTLAECKIAQRLTSQKNEDW